MKSTRAQLLPLMFEMGRMLKSEMSRQGVLLPSHLHLETLRFIQSKEKLGTHVTMSELSDYLKVARPSATALVNGLVRDGVLARVSDSGDRRVVRLVLSRKGDALLKETLLKRDRAFLKVTKALSDTDCEHFKRILTVITKYTP
jgi:DNA-binding MarR family transcriptional regulator